MEEFLKTVAKHYKQKSCDEAQLKGELASLPLTRSLFCFPNRRSGLFFARHLREAFGTTCLVPPMTTVNELYGKFSQRYVVDRTALLFSLYKVYSQLNKRSTPETFDQFVFWGDMLLSDFDDIDKYLVDADKLFANIKDLKEIEARFSGFTQEQIDVITSFWTSFRPDRTYEEGDKREVFGQTWAILSQLYHSFKATLEQENMAYEGMMEREVLEKLQGLVAESQDPFADFPYDKVVFVGLTAISKVDRAFMSLLKVHGRAEFCWDYADPRLKPDNKVATSAAFFTQANLSDFENEISADELDEGLVSDVDREISLYSIASGVGQTAQARKQLLSWIKEAGNSFVPLRTAVVLPDEKLLLPMLYAMPKSQEGFNVTMGYALKNTPVAAFIHYLADLQQAYRESSDTFYFRQVLPILSHSFLLGLIGEKARSVTRYITSHNLNQVPVSVFADDELLKLIFKPLANASDTLDYLVKILQILMARAAEDIHLQSEEESAANEASGEHLQTSLSFEFEGDEQPGERQEVPIFTDTDYEFLYHYHKTVASLQKEVASHSIQFETHTLFSLLEKLVAGVSVPFSGEPLRGIQVMGVLETRSLDFDNVVILSMNEGTFPAKPVQNTFIPMSLRDAFELPTQRHRDSVFAYHFYRLISRAKHLTLIYDSRTDGMKSGEESRYIKQLRYLMGHEDLQAETIGNNISVVQPTPFEVVKTPAVMDKLNQFLRPKGTRRLSATALQHYISCPLQFYLNCVEQVNEEDEISEGVDAKIFGDILHLTLQRIYQPMEDKLIDSAWIDNLLREGKGKELVAKELYQAYFDIFNNIDLKHLDEEEQSGRRIVPAPIPEGYNLLVTGILLNYVLNALREDKHSCPFTFKASERVQYIDFKVNEQLQVQFRCVYDRIDHPEHRTDDVLRLVDYKTGNSSKGNKLNFGEVSDLFKSDGKGSKEAFQVMLYCLLLGYATPRDLQQMHLDKLPEHIAPHLYFVRDFNAYRPTKTALTQKVSRNESKQVDDFSDYRDEFKSELVAMLTEIFDPATPFKQCTNKDTCKYCQFKNLCKRI